MVHLRLNENEPNPNPLVNFITALPTADTHEQERARQLLRALAAQVRPVMKAHGFVVNSLEEYEYNHVFAGRNWNNGETVELVLRRRDGSFVSTSWLIGTLCHELAHIKHMNHGSDFQALWSQLRKEVIALQTKGYYGDGMWSSGTRLADSAIMVGSGPIEDDLPEYMCGGAQSRARPSARRRRRQPVAGSSTLTGAQTAKRRKAGSRITAAGIFAGSGQALNADECKKIVGTGFRKKAGSKRAREERALAAERRLLGDASETSTRDREDGDSDSDAQELQETDQDRHQTMMKSMDASEAGLLRTGTLSDLWGDFILPRRPTREGHGTKCKATGKEGLSRVTLQRTGNPSIDTSSSATALRPEASKPRLGKLEQEEISHIQQKSPAQAVTPLDSTVAITLSNSIQSSKVHNVPRPQKQMNEMLEWSCLVCTLDNEPDHLACSACGTPRGDTHLHRAVH